MEVYVYVCSYLITMRSPKTRFTPLKIASLVVGGIAIIVHITAVGYPEWDGIDAIWRPVPKAQLPIKAHASLWDLTVTDKSRKMFSPVRENRDTSKLYNTILCKYCYVL